MRLLRFIFLAELDKYMLPCVTKQCLGFDCPGCGLQRSILYLLKGDLANAIYMYPAIITLIPLFLIIVLGKFLKLKIANVLIIGLSIASVVLILVNFILKLMNIKPH